MTNTVNEEYAAFAAKHADAPAEMAERLREAAASAEYSQEAAGYGEVVIGAQRFLELADLFESHPESSAVRCVAAALLDRQVY